MPPRGALPVQPWACFMPGAAAVWNIFINFAGHGRLLPSPAIQGAATLHQAAKAAGSGMAGGTSRSHGKVNK